MSDNTKHAALYYKDVVYCIGIYATIHRNGEDEYVYQLGFSNCSKRTKLYLLKEYCDGVFNGKYVLHIKNGWCSGSIFYSLYEAVINCGIESFWKEREKHFQYYLAIGIYIHDSVYKFFQQVVVDKKPQLLYEPNGHFNHI